LFWNKPCCEYYSFIEKSIYKSKKVKKYYVRKVEKENCPSKKRAAPLPATAVVDKELVVYQVLCIVYSV